MIMSLDLHLYANHSKIYLSPCDLSLSVQSHVSACLWHLPLMYHHQLKCNVDKNERLIFHLKASPLVQLLLISDLNYTSLLFSEPPPLHVPHYSPYKTAAEIVFEDCHSDHVTSSFASPHFPLDQVQFS